ncbi:MAG: MMPL family transporter [Rhizobiales bacterium]|nr:MMPL family transporter [Hyphomicrobiales bacterium]MBO6699116.1 MMPL family transporter [Hyphomicrobiales bacterium]MBO6736654.1 MMPL family transporter [Hyphomicrobiales bacterium]MBO6912272.1 MMPL family transporter [Hyphomicrobiales bacterium]MBO6956517.1 MMPL family transporter [Hyphomicrobiales bacterium]
MRFLPLLALQRPLAAALCVAVLASLAVAGLLRLGFDDGMESAFAGQTQAFLDFSLNRERFTPAEGDIAVNIRADAALMGTQLEAVRGFTLDAAFAPHVDSTVSVFALRSPPVSGSPSQPLLPLDLAGADDLPALLASARDHPLGGDRLVSEDLSQTLVLVTLRPGEADLESARETITELEALTADLSNADQNLDVAITGMVPIRQIVIDGLLRDLLVLNAIGIGIGSLICIIALRSVLLSLLTGLPAALALLWVLGAMGWLGLEINTVTNAIPVLILVLALCDSLHLTYEVRRQAPLHADLADAIKEAAVRVAPACALTSFTTAIAFAALLISPSELVRSLGWSGVAATLISLLAILLAHPLVFLGASRTPVLSMHLEALLARPPVRRFTAFQGHGMWRFAMRRPRPVAAVSLVVLVAALGLFSQARPEYTFLENVSPQNEAFQALRQVDAAITPTAAIDLPVRLTGEGDLQRVASAVDAARVAVPDGKISSLLDIASWIGAPVASATLEDLETVLDRLSPTQRLRYVSSDGAWALVRLYVPDQGAQATQILLDRLQDRLEDLEVPADAVGRPTGLLTMSSTSSLTMIGHLNISFTVAVLAAGLFVAVWFRSPLYGLVALVPNILPIVCVGAWLFLSGNGLQFSSAIALTIAFGIAVDDTVHVLNRLHLVAPRDRPFDTQSVRQVFDDLAPVLVTTTVVLAFGMLGSQFSAVPTIAYFGILCIVVFALALIAVLVVLPAVMLAPNKSSVSETSA